MNIPAAIAAAVPPEEPPAILVLSQGFLTAPWQELLGYAIGQFMKIGLCTGDSAFLEQSLQRRGVFFCGIVESSRAPVVISMEVSILSLIIREVPQAGRPCLLQCFDPQRGAGFEVFFIQRNNAPDQRYFGHFQLFLRHNPPLF